jgi:alpha-1,2-mannosyltransferase
VTTLVPATGRFEPSDRFVRLLPILAMVAIVAVPGFVVWSGVVADTLGFDFLAYHQAANRLLAGLPLYDPTLLSLHVSSPDELGATVPFLYPPPFALAIIPLAALPATAATWVWLGLSVASLLAAIWLMPVSTAVRWLTLLLAGLSWPVAYALKLGQVGPLLLLLFAIGWRWLDRPSAVGVSGAAGAIVKIQPGIVLAWALLTRRWTAVAVGAAVLVGAGLLSIVIAGGVSDWIDYVAMLRNAGDPITTPNNLSPGAVLYQSLHVPSGIAAGFQLVSSVAALGLAVFAALRATPAASYLTAVVASQLLLPVLWDHYAMLLLLPTAWLLQRGHGWAVAIPLSTSVLVLFIVPAAAYPAAFWVTLIAVVTIGIRDARRIGARVVAGPAA